MRICERYNRRWMSLLNACVDLLIMIKFIWSPWAQVKWASLLCVYVVILNAQKLKRNPSIYNWQVPFLQNNSCYILFPFPRQLILIVPVATAGILWGRLSHLEHWAVVAYTCTQQFTRSPFPRKWDLPQGKLASWIFSWLKAFCLETLSPTKKQVL